MNGPGAAVPLAMIPLRTARGGGTDLVAAAEREVRRALPLAASAADAAAVLAYRLSGG